MNMRMSRALIKVSGLSLCALAFLVPLVAFPWTTDALDFNKYFVLAALVTVGGLAWMGGMLVKRGVTLKLHWLFVVPLLFLGATALSSAFSLAPYVSWLGEGGQEYVSFLGTFLLTVLFIMAGQLMADKRVQQQVMVAMFLGSGVLAAIALLAFFGPSLGVFTNTIGNPSTVAVYFLVMAIFGSGVWLVATPDESGHAIFAGVLGMGIKASIILTNIAALFLLVSMDEKPLWALVIIGLMPLFAFGLAVPKSFTRPLAFLFPMLLFVSALLFFFLPGFGKNPYALEVRPTTETSLGIIKGTWTDSSVLLGSGPGTFSLDYAKFAPTKINSTILWDTRLDRANSHFLTLLTTHGVIGALMFVLFLVVILVLTMRYVFLSRTHDGWKDVYGPLAAWLVLLFAVFLFSSNLTLLVLLTLISAILAARVLPEVREIAFESSPRLAIVAMFFCMLFGIGLLLTLFVSLSRYSAEFAFAKAAARDREGAALDDIIPLLETAVARNQWSDLYVRNLGNAYLMKTARLSEEGETDPEELNRLAHLAAAYGEMATTLSPNFAVNWDFRGGLYRELSISFEDANTLALASYEEAIKLAPNNPKYRVGLARTYIVRVDLLQKLIQGEDKELAEEAKTSREVFLQKAREALDKAIALKSDYMPARYYSAFVHERQGNLADAVRSMEIVRATNPNDIGVSMQLGLLYLRQGKNDLAQAELERALEIAPTFANARWYLAFIFEDEGEAEKAIAELEKILIEEPDRPEVVQRLERLRKGQEEAVLPEPIDESVGEPASTDPIDGPIVP